MKSLRYLFAAALVILAACSKEKGTDTAAPAGETFVFTAQVEDTKAMISGTKTLWENGDEISVFSDAAPSSSYTFSTSPDSPVSSAEFTYTGNFEKGESYMALYPAAAGISADFAASKISGLVIPANQTLGNNYIYATAYSTDGETLAFKNATSLVRFQVADGRVVSGALNAAEGKNIAGTFAATLDSEGIPTLTATADGSNTISFDLGGTTKLSAGTDYYVAAAPAASSFSLRLQNAGGSYIEKTYEVSSLERKKIYGVGDATSNNNVSKIVLNFNFADGDAMNFGDWTARLGRSVDITTGTFTLNGQSYTFQSAKKASSTGSTWPSFGGDSDPAGQLHFTQSSCLGLPLITGYKLVTITFDTEDTNNTQPLYFEGERLAAPTSEYSIGAVKYPDNLTFDVSEKSTNYSEYWLYQAGSGTQAFDMSAITLTYVKK